MKLGQPRIDLLEIEGACYEIKQELGYGDAVTASIWSVKSAQAALKIQGVKEMIENNMFDSQEIENALQMAKEASLNLIHLWLWKWSYEDMITLENIARLPQEHVNQLIRKIADNTSKNRLAQKDAPLAAPSNGTPAVS